MERIASALQSKGMSRFQLAKALGVTPGAVSHWLIGRRRCPPDVLARAAEILRIDKGSLLEPSLAHAKASALKGGDSMAQELKGAVAEVTWQFRPAPNDGGRDFGNPNIWATPPDVNTLVRETGQNTLDAARGGRIHLRYTLIQLSQGKDAYERFMRALQFHQLKQHLTGAARTQSKLGTRLRGGLERLEHEGRLLLLRISDYGTTGLRGDEKSDDQPFAALVRDNLFSAKQGPTAIGSFGLGKAVLWRCSDISTVLFGSHVAVISDGAEVARPRFIGKAELTWHLVENQAYAGPGWLAGSGTNSVWDADHLLKDLYLRRDPLPDGIDGPLGTSILIIGFRDPQAEVGADPADLMAKLTRAAAENFWPAMRSQTTRLEVSVELVVDDVVTDSVMVVPQKYVRPFWEALERHREDRLAEQLTEPGDVVRVVVPFTVPGTRPEAHDLIAHDELAGHCLLLVRLAESEDGPEDELLNRVAMIRGRGMVTRYLSQAGIVVGGRPFHGVLLAGEAVGSEQVHRAADQFLRLAEPPAHHRWEYTEDLREKYRRGSGVRLKDLHSGITTALREAIKPPEVGEEDAPAELARLLQIEGVPPPEAPPATLRRIEHLFVDGAWLIEGEIHINDRKKGWAVTPRLWLDVESGSRPRVAWSSLEAVEGNVERKGDCFMLAPGTKRVAFRGTSDPTSHHAAAGMCRARLDLACQEVADEEGRR
jgi:RNA polymerase primary sigma factor